MTPSSVAHNTADAPASRDRGAVLGFVLIFFVFVGLTLTATLTFTTTLIQNRSPINERNARVEAVRSAMRMAIQFQRDQGVGGCFNTSQSFTFNEGRPEEVSATVNCAIGAPEDLDNNYFREGGEAFALITTNRSGDGQTIIGAQPDRMASYPAPYKLIEGNVFVSGGDVSDLTDPSERRGDDILVGNQTDGSPSNVFLAATATSGWQVAAGATDCETARADGYMPTSGTGSDGVAHSNISLCLPVDWTERAGTRVGGGGAWTYPALPGLPANRRPAFAPKSFGTDEDRGVPCRVVFPGRYDQELLFDDGATYYLPSGVFYLTEPMVVSNGSKVVAGQGRELGCEVDSTVLLNKNTVDIEATSVTGLGATFVLDGDATIEVNQAELYINRRISTPSTRGSEGVAIHTVQIAAVDDADHLIPQDDVVTGVDSAGNRILEPSSSYSTQSSVSSTTIQYQGISAAADGTDDLVKLDFTSGAGSAFVADGNIFLPQGTFKIQADQADYQFEVDGGIVASIADFDVEVAPANADRWYLGIDAKPLLRRVQLEAVATVRGKTARSIALFQVNSVGNYAINTWTVDPNGSSGGWSGGTTDGGTTDGGTTDGGTTDGGTTDGGTDPCLPEDNWTGEYFDNMTLTGTPELVRQDSGIDFNWGYTAPVGPNGETFSVRWSRKLALTPGDYTFTMGGDDGVRLIINGDEVITNWSNHSYQTRVVNLALTGSCAHDVVMEYYENIDDARATLTWGLDLTCPPDDDNWYGEYHNGTGLNNYSGWRWDSSPNYDWGQGSPDNDLLGDNTFSIKWTRIFNFPEPGTYRFTVGSDDGTRLYINGEREINNWQVQNYEQGIRSADVVIEDHCGVQLEMHYFENEQDARVSYAFEKLSD
jgi:hypothetical protein